MSGPKWTSEERIASLAASLAEEEENARQAAGSVRASRGDAEFYANARRRLRHHEGQVTAIRAALAKARGEVQP